MIFPTPRVDDRAVQIDPKREMSPDAESSEGRRRYFPASFKCVTCKNFNFHEKYMLVPISSSIRGAPQTRLLTLLKKDSIIILFTKRENIPPCKEVNEVKFSRIKNRPIASKERR
ncbi:MAG: hypothetical protein LBF42_03320 [Puniceicoccales bacterium]|nr:hypothetical protein [Puniceicoccales bacterium]